MIRIAAGLLAAMAAIGVAEAEELVPLQARSITLGEVTGVAYYTVGENGFEVVATLAAGEAATPMRFVATLISGQSIIVSVPQAAGEDPLGLEIARRGEVVFISEPEMVASAVLN